MKPLEINDASAMSDHKRPLVRALQVAVWALVALRPRRRPAWEVEPASDDGWDDDPAEEWLEDYREDERPDVVQPGYRTDTVERPAVRRPSWDDRGDGRRRG